MLGSLPQNPKRFRDSTVDFSVCKPGEIMLPSSPELSEPRLKEHLSGLSLVLRRSQPGTLALVARRSRVCVMPCTRHGLVGWLASCRMRVWAGSVVVAGLLCGILAPSGVASASGDHVAIDLPAKINAGTPFDLHGYRKRERPERVHGTSSYCSITRRWPARRRTRRRLVFPSSKSTSRQAAASACPS